MKYLFTLNIGYGRSASQEEEMEFPDDITEEQLEQEWKDWIWNYIDGGFRPVD